MFAPRRPYFGLLLAILVLLTGCREQGSESAPVASAQDSGGSEMRVTSDAFKDGQPIPVEYTGTGEDVSPPLAWRGLPESARELALIVDDPDAPSAEPWVHWVIYGIPAAAGNLPEGVPQEEAIKQPVAARQGVNSFRDNNIGYRGPMPPPGHGVHHYHFRLYALDERLDLEPGATRERLEEAMDGHVVGEAELVGTFQR